MAEKDAEIERLRAVAAREIAQCHEDIREKDAEIERLEDLLARADALISELRKAAQNV